jgi:2-C-methyl-D-erythritol 4-phosphate cytidylyltransferase
VKNVAVILSGGVGSRFGSILPKQFAKLAGKTVIEYTLQTFEDSSVIDEIIIVSKNEFIEKIWGIVKKNQWKKIVKIVVGGKERFDSTWSALQSIVNYAPDTKIIFHDAVRPFISDKIIEECIHKLDVFVAVDVVIPSADTIVEIYDDCCIKNIPNRTSIRRGQTPQAFKLNIIRDAYEKAIAQSNTVFTCDCGVVRAMLPHIRVATIEGSDQNIKITHSIDLFLAEKLLQISDKSNIGTHLDLHKLNGKNIVIFGGTSGIGQEMSNIAKLCGANVFVASRRYNLVDITKKSDVVSFLDSVSKNVLTIDAIVNTAGFLIKKPFELLSNDEIKSLIDINYLGAVNVAIASKPYLEKSNGMLLNFTSSSYTRGRAYYSLYSSTKAAIVNLTQALAEEWGYCKIKVNCINPERTSTPMRVLNFGKEDESLLLSAKEVAEISLKVLLSDKTSIVVDIRKDGLNTPKATLSA